MAAFVIVPTTLYLLTDRKYGVCSNSSEKDRESKGDIATVPSHQTECSLSKKYRASNTKAHKYMIVVFQKVIYRLSNK